MTDKESVRFVIKGEQVIRNNFATNGGLMNKTTVSLLFLLVLGLVA